METDAMKAERYARRLNAAGHRGLRWEAYEVLGKAAVRGLGPDGRVAASMWLDPAGRVVQGLTPAEVRRDEAERKLDEAVAEWEATR